MLPFIQNRPYSGPVKAVILDWAGTAVDFGSLAPPAVLVEIFERAGIGVTTSEVRQFMGLMKKDHIRKICALPRIAEQWRDRYGRSPDGEDVERLYRESEPLMADIVTRYADPIRGLLETVDALRKEKILIGASTGYTAPMMAPLAAAAERKGYRPDALVCPGDVPAGRPYPWMCYLNAIKLQVYPMAALVKIGDTIADIQEGLNAGMWTIGLTVSGNEMGLSAEAVARLAPEDLAARRRDIENRFFAAGVHYVADGVWDCLPVIRKIGQRLGNRENPLPKPLNSIEQD